jgi:predicted O-linked N-acetylglucosamine transferase (SPINDLY family)
MSEQDLLARPGVPADGPGVLLSDELLLQRARAHWREGERQHARLAYETILERDPMQREALLGLSGLCIAEGEPGLAQTLLLRCCGVHPDIPEAWDALGIAFLLTGEPAAAETAFLAAGRLAPGRLDIAGRRAEAAWLAGHGESELARLHQFLADDPADIAALTAAGLLLDRMGRRAEAADMLEAASALVPDQPLLAAALGSVLARLFRSKEAEVALRHALALAPGAAQARGDLGVVLMRLHRHAEAEIELRHALEIEPGDTKTACNLANAILALGRQSEAVALLEQLIAKVPDAHLPRRTLANTLPYTPDITAARLTDAARAASRSLPRRSAPRFSRTPEPDRRLRIGILSGSLRTHPVGWLTVAGFEALDQEGFELIGLAHPVADDTISRRFRAVASEWHDVQQMNDLALAEQADRLGLDMLIDLGGYGEAGRMAACAHRLAPVQIKWVGMQNHSSGLAEMDWFIADRWEVPPALEPFYSERVLRLRDGYVCYSPPPYAPEVGPLPALRNGFVTFGCFNNLAKITPEVIRTWSRILGKVEGSRLVLKTYQLTEAPTVERLRRAFESCGVDPARVAFRGASPHRAFLAEYNDIDLVLDPFPYSGGLTTCEAMWMGVPTITVPGEIFAARHSLSHLSNAGFDAFVAADLDAYEAMACRWAGEVDRLAALRARMREQVRASPLCDARRFGESLGMALRHAWTDWCARGEA